jgi:hypothetical protein
VNLTDFLQKMPEKRGFAPPSFLRQSIDLHTSGLSLPVVSPYEFDAVFFRSMLELRASWPI